MFSRFLQFLQSLFTRSTAGRNLTGPVSMSAPRVKVELAEVVDEGMVTTRLQEHVQPGTTLVGGLEDVTTPESQRRKRKSNGVVDGSRTQSAEKRRCTSTSSSAPTRGPLATVMNGPSTAAAKEIPCSEPKSVKSDTSIHTSRPLSPSQASFTPQPATSHQPQDTINPALEEPRNNDLLENGAAQVDDVKYNPVVPPRKQNARMENAPGSPKAAVLRGRMPTTNEMISTKKPIHKRFGSDEPGTIEDTENIAREPDSAAAAINTDVQYAEDDDEDDDDDVPEVVTTSVGLEQVHKAAVGASQAIERQAAARKDKRRKLDAQLKRQVVLAKKARRRKEALLPDNNSNPINPSIGSDSKNTHSMLRGHSLKIDPKNLPALLPDEILSKEPFVQPLIPNLPATALKSNKRKFIDVEPKLPKDIKHGSVSVRVLPPTKFTLPPKAAKSSRQLKEGWLAGHRARNGHFTSRRRKIEGGFLRK